MYYLIFLNFSKNKLWMFLVEWPLRPFRPNREVRDAMLAKGKEDTTTIATISLMFYYTCEFAESTEDVEAYVDEVKSYSIILFEMF